MLHVSKPLKSWIIVEVVGIKEGTDAKKIFRIRLYMPWQESWMWRMREGLKKKKGYFEGSNLTDWLKERWCLL